MWCKHVCVCVCVCVCVEGERERVEGKEGRERVKLGGVRKIYAKWL